jgi:hypothetical protein
VVPMTCWICVSVIMLLLSSVEGGLRVRSAVRWRTVVQALGTLCPPCLRRKHWSVA